MRNALIGGCVEEALRQMMWKSYIYTGNEEGYTFHEEELSQDTAYFRNSKRNYEKISCNI